MAGDCLQLRRRFEPVEPGQLDALDFREPLELGEEWQQRVPAMQLVRPVREDEPDPRLMHVPDEESQQVTRRLVGPVQVLDDHDDG